ncbi:hypothetical protein P167DRAFT_541379 [Morchella conica CCBAS932]|uniref:Uncharacterized protein n=1 Tax=Morchella conica CCBAS932 TaxID=1392247 RepID=A0A3N4L6A8_9PEZI|nr:hypothetical protein P167DRAFT_541379 [Morchella conica CCBAS932]
MNGHVPALLTDQLSLLSFINYDAVNGTHYNVVAVTSQIAAKYFTSTARITETPSASIVNSTPNAGSTNGEPTIRQAQAICGKARLNCCNRVAKKDVLGCTVDGTPLVGGIYPGTDLVIQCLPLDMLVHDGIVLPQWGNEQVPSPRSRSMDISMLGVSCLDYSRKDTHEAALAGIGIYILDKYC